MRELVTWSQPYARESGKCSSWVGSQPPATTPHYGRGGTYYFSKQPAVSTTMTMKKEDYFLRSSITCSSPINPRLLELDTD